MDHPLYCGRDGDSGPLEWGLNQTQTQPTSYLWQPIPPHSKPQLLLPGSASATFSERLPRSPVHVLRPWFYHESGRAYSEHTLAHRYDELQAQGI